MKIYDDNCEVEIEPIADDYCPECGGEWGDVYFIPTWAVKRCGECLIHEAKKYGYIVI